MRSKPPRGAKSGQARGARALKDSSSPPPRRKAIPNLDKVRASYGLKPAVFARMLGISPSALARLEKGEAPSDASILARFGKVKAILKRAAGTMRREYLPTWIEKPSEACSELGANAPIDLMERGDYDAVTDLLFFLGSGVPS
jgi:transcriptional regulator with XRE-family HTH domain